MLGKDLSLNYKGLRALCVRGGGGTQRFSDFAGTVCRLACARVHACACS